MVDWAEGDTVIKAYAEITAERLFFLLGGDLIEISVDVGCAARVLLLHAVGGIKGRGVFCAAVFSLHGDGVIKRGENESVFTEGGQACIAVIQHGVDDRCGSGVGVALVFAEGKDGFTKGANVVKAKARCRQSQATVFESRKCRPTEIIVKARRVAHDDSRFFQKADFHAFTFTFFRCCGMIIAESRKEHNERLGHF